jgi:hypothetical protein
MKGHSKMDRFLVASKPLIKQCLDTNMLERNLECAQPIKPGDIPKIKW